MKSKTKPVMKTITALLFLQIFASSCMYYSNNHTIDSFEENESSTTEHFNEDLVDFSVVDSSKFEKMYESFLSSVDTTSRSTAIIDSIINVHTVVIKNIILTSTAKDTSKKEKEKYFQLLVDTTGVFEIHLSGHNSDSASKAFFKDNILRIGTLKKTSGLFTKRGITLVDSTLQYDSINRYTPSKFGGRSRASIMRIVMENVDKMRSAYNHLLTHESDAQGKITVRFAIDHFGGVITCSLYESTFNYPAFKDVVMEQVRNWKFDAIPIKGDVTEVIYPFVFSQ